MDVETLRKLFLILLLSTQKSLYWEKILSIFLQLITLIETQMIDQLLVMKLILLFFFFQILKTANIQELFQILGKIISVLNACVSHPEYVVKT